MRVLISAAALAPLFASAIGAQSRAPETVTAAQSAILDLKTGTSRPLATAGMATRAPRWSPDGRHIAMQSSTDGRTWSVTIANADGSSPRTYPIPAPIINVQSIWSPSGSHVAVRTNSELWVVDVADGTSRRLGPSVHPHHLAWRDDSTIVIARVFNTGTKEPWSWRIFETSFGGTEKPLRDLSSSFPGPALNGFNANGAFVGPQAYVVLNPRRVIVNPYGGDIVLPGDGPRSGAPGNTPDGAFLALGVGTDTAPVRALEMIDVAKRASTIFPLPFLGRTAGFSRPAMLPDHSAAIVLGRGDTTSTWGFYEVAFAAGRTRRIATIPGDPRAYHFDLSPDGRYLLYTADVPQNAAAEPDWAASFDSVTRRLQGETPHAQLQRLFELNARFARALDAPVIQTVNGHRAAWYSDAPDRMAAWHRAYVSRVKAARVLTSDSLTAADRLYLSVLSVDADRAAIRARFPEYMMPVRWNRGQHRELSGIVGMPTRTAADFEEILVYLRGIRPSIDEAMAAMRAGMAAGVTAPRSTIEGEASVIQRLAEAPDSAYPLLAPFKRIPPSVPDTTRARILAEANAIVRDEIRPVFRRFDHFFREEYLPKARTSLGMLALPDGKAWFAAIYQDAFTSPMTPEDVERLGQRELARVEVSLDSAQRTIGFQGSRASFLKHMMTDSAFQVHDTATLRALVSTIAKRIDGALFQVVDTVPSLMPYAVAYVDSSAMGTASSGQASFGSWRNRKPPTLWLNASKMDALPTWKLENLVLHETYPGHLLQGGWNQQPAAPFAPRIQVAAFVEGWAMYAETLGPELGLYRDPYSRLGLLAGELDRALRLVVETGIHLHGWSREQALTFLRQHGMEPESVNQLAVDRFISLPTLLTAHMVGREAFLQLRQEASTRLGPKFDLKRFHTEVLRHGSLPIGTLQEVVRAWIDREAEQRAAKP